MDKQIKTPVSGRTRPVLSFARPASRWTRFLRSYQPHALLLGVLIVLTAWSDADFLQLLSADESVHTVSTASGAVLAGSATVIDGDTIKLNGERIRLFGIDAFESKQTCRLSDQSAWPCGRAGTNALRSYVTGITVYCHGDARDRYGRLVATCEAQSQDLGEWMVLQGLALAYRKYSPRYIQAENTARNNKTGVHSGTYTPPWIYRRRGV